MDPRADLAALDAREARLFAELAQVRADRARIHAELVALATPREPEPLLDPAALVDRWRREGLSSCPASASALMERMRLATQPGARWYALRQLGARHRQGRIYRWPWSEAVRAIRGET